MKKIYEEFKEFAFRGDLVSLAVAFVMAAAFGAVIKALVEFVVMPIVGIIFGEPTFDYLTWTINGSVIAYGSFLTAAVVFLATAIGVFLFIVKPYKAYQAAKAEEEEEAPAELSEDVKLLMEIRDALSK
ncbi:MAG: large conductance mechanosensitive channel protein MscL [bacterium]|nr:large conductance mechanosensitive channel protein MscL [bacterium]